MASRTPNKTFESPVDKLSSSTLKRHPKTELSKPDLIQLLGVLEGELQAREIVIAVLKAEQVKQLLYPNKKSAALSDPWCSLQRDVFGALDGSFDEAAVKSLYSTQLHQLQQLIVQQRKAQARLKEQLRHADDRYAKAVKDLDEERQKHAQDTAQGDDVTYLLEKERERLRHEVEFERQQNRRYDKEVQKITETLEHERNKHKQIILLLLAERKRLIMRLLEERQRTEDLTQVLSEEKGRIEDMVEGLEDESKKSLQMEAEMEKQLCDFEFEREQFKAQYSLLELKNQELVSEVQRLAEEVEAVRKGSGGINLGEGVRSTIVTVVSTPVIRPTITPTVPPPRSIAKALNPKAVPATPTKPSGLVPTKTSTGSRPTVSSSSSIASSSSVTSPPQISSKAAKVLSPSVETASSSDYNAPSSAAESQLGGILTTGPKTAIATSVKLTPTISRVATGVATSPSTPPPLAAKKLTPMGRGAPPPIPPNKPILAQHRKELASSSNSPTSGTKPPVPPRTEQDKPIMAAGTRIPPVTANKPESSSPADVVASTEQVSDDPLAPELANFQKLLISMGANASTIDS